MCAQRIAILILGDGTAGSKGVKRRSCRTTAETQLMDMWPLSRGQDEPVSRRKIWKGRFALGELRVQHHPI